ncbi:ComF family protein [Limosilactobacillus caecicola]|uniref:ComF family protein n=1 Tax=Limosilactobacillus caecicola TaxID=2941332 RepID=UPI00203D87FE|nr:ComF family protein [Limosilactobacillus caecicola]
MKQCLICSGSINWQPSFHELISWRPLTPPVICQQCQQQFALITDHDLCRGCGRQRESLCPDCQTWQEQLGFVIHNRSLYSYNDAMKEYMHSYKFMGDYRLRQVFQRQFTALVKSISADVVIPIPVTQHTRLTRGFNQVTGLLEDCRLVTDVLLTSQQHKLVPQSHKKRTERLLAPQPFMLQQATKIKGKKVLLVDDVYTTGRTIYHAATLCRQAGCESVSSVALAS